MNNSQIKIVEKDYNELAILRLFNSASTDEDPMLVIGSSSADSFPKYMFSSSSTPIR